MYNLTQDEMVALFKFADIVASDLTATLSTNELAIPRFVDPNYNATILSAGIARFIAGYILSKIEGNPTEITKDFCTLITETVASCVMSVEDVKQ